MNDEKNIQIVSGGNTDELDISPVYDNLDISKPSEDSNVKKNVIIPEEKKN